VTELFRPTALAIQKLFNQFDPAVRDEDAAPADGRFAPIFIVGPPRSGSTLLYQALCRGLEVSYISNLMSLLPRFMVRLAPVSLRHAPSAVAPFDPGDFGFLPGLFAPSEAGKIVDKWFSAGGDADHHRDMVRRSLAAIGRRTGRPLLVKCPSLVLKLDAVLQTVPNARLIVLAREPAFVVQSLLLGKAKPELAADRWEGIEPPGSETHRGDGPEAEIAWQIAEILRIIEQGAASAQPGCITRVAYEDFCSDPRSAVRRMGCELGLEADVRGLPERFEISRSRRVSEFSWNRIVSACADNGLGSAA
jgi:hypothetical protein